MTGSILTLNAGSSSVKFAVFDGTTLKDMVRGEIEDLDEAAPHLIARDAAGAVLAERRWKTTAGRSYAEALDALLAFADAHLGRDGLAAAGHRVVDGGADYIVPETVTPALLTALEALTPLDPLHMPLNLAPIRAIAAARPALAQVACFDTAFHHTLPPVATRFALPRELAAAGVRRYGFHGLSYEYIASCLKQQSPQLARSVASSPRILAPAPVSARSRAESASKRPPASARSTGWSWPPAAAASIPALSSILVVRGTASPISRTCSTVAPACSAHRA